MPGLVALRPHGRPSPTLPCLLRRRATFINARVKWVRDRGLDLAVSKENHLHPFLALKNLLLSHRHRSLPLSFVADRRHRLRLPFPALRFIRVYPSAFVQTITTTTVIRPTQELVLLHREEMETYVSCREDCAYRLARLLMLTRRRRLPLPLVDRLAFDLGLPCNYATTLLPEYLDYFEIVSGGRDGLDLELVCWNKDLGVSALQKAAFRQPCRFPKSSSAPLAFPLQFPLGFDLDKRVKKWTEDFQNLPYMSPYENGTVLDPRSAVAEKWTVGVLHELLSLLVSKKTEKENLLELGKHVGLPDGFKKVITWYPGIFYLSNKLRTQTVVLRESYKRDRLVDKHPLMGMRYRYIFLMSRGAARGDMEGQEDEEEPRGTSSDSENVEEDDDDDHIYENERGSAGG